jgi:hypothetical protein
VVRLRFPRRHRADPNDVCNARGARAYVFEGEQAERRGLSRAMTTGAPLEQNWCDITGKRESFLRVYAMSAKTNPDKDYEDEKGDLHQNGSGTVCYEQAAYSNKSMV